MFVISFYFLRHRLEQANNEVYMGIFISIFSAAPKYVEILLEDGRTSAAIRNVSRIGPFNEGTTVTLLCRSGGGRPVPRIQWWSGNRILEGIINTNYSITKKKKDGITNFLSFDFRRSGEMIASQEDSGAVMGINRLQVTLTRQDLAAQWQCRVHSPALSSHLVAHLNVDVHGIFTISDVVLHGNVEILFFSQSNYMVKFKC